MNCSLPSAASRDHLIVTLLGSTVAETAGAERMVGSLHHLQDGGETPLLVFHDPGSALIRERLDGRARTHGRPLCVAAVDWPANPTFSRAAVAVTDTHNRQGWGYFHMINFFFRGMLQHRALAVLRLDCDSMLIAPTPNLFELLAQPSNLDLAYVAVAPNRDCGRIVQGLRPLAEAASRRHNRSLHHLFATGVVDGRPGAPCVKGFYNNFELLRVDHFR